MSNTVLYNVKSCMMFVNYTEDSINFDYDEGIKCAMNELILANNYQDKADIILAMRYLLDNRKKFEKKFDKYPGDYDKIELLKIELPHQANENLSRTYIITDALGKKNAIHIFSNDFDEKVMVPFICSKKQVKLTQDSKLRLVRSAGRNLIIDDNKKIICQVNVNKYQEIELIANKLTVDVYNNETTNILEYYPKRYLDSLLKKMIPNDKNIVGKCLTNKLDKPKRKGVSILTNYSSWMDPEFMVLISIAALRR